ncbi:MAG: SMC-Scp complex subunit ScpB [Patescibacteria group bacterium]
MSPLAVQIEALLFASSKPLSVAKLGQLTDTKKPQVEEALAEITAVHAERVGGIRVLVNGDEAQMVTAPAAAETVAAFLKDETTGELSRPSLETLTIVAYRGPVTKPEIEQIRGVNCSLILRNLLMRGLVEATEDKRLLQTTYRISMEFLRHLGVNAAQDLPDYGRLNAHPNLVMSGDATSAAHSGAETLTV